MANMAFEGRIINFVHVKPQQACGKRAWNAISGSYEARNSERTTIRATPFDWE
jgi:hypothetical protein